MDTLGEQDFFDSQLEKKNFFFFKLVFFIFYGSMQC